MENVSDTPTYNIKNVEVFSSGEWNKDKYSVEDLHSIVTSFNSLKEGFRPYVKLGHDNKQQIAKSSGLPSIGWVDNLYVKGTKLFADLNYIPKKVYQLIKSKAYRKVSCEIYFDLDVNGIKYPKVLSAIALLGAENPGVMNLADILGNYTLNQNNKIGVFESMAKKDSFKAYEHDFETNMGDEKMSEELKSLQEKIEAGKKDYETIETAKLAVEKELATEREEIKKYRDAAELAQMEAKSAKVATFILELENKRLSTPSMKDLVTELMSDKKEYSIKEKSMTKEEVLVEILTLSKEAAKVNFEESSRADFAKGGNKEKDTEEKIAKYAKDNKCSYTQAYKAVMKGEDMDLEDVPAKKDKGE